MLELIENGACYGRNVSQHDPGCATDAAAMNQKFGTDQGVFHEYAQRFPERFEYLQPGSPFNLRPMHTPEDRAQNCSIVHYIGWPCPSGIWFEGQSMAQVVEELPMLQTGPSLSPSIRAFLATSKLSTEWGLRLWRDRWNDAVVSKWASRKEAATPLSNSSPSSLSEEEGPQEGEQESIRFVLFLVNAKYFAGAVAAVHSLAESATATSKPPLVMIMSNGTIQAPPQAFLEHIGAEVLHVTVPQDLTDAMRVHKVGDRWKGVFTKMLFFNRKLVGSDIVFYIDTDAVARGNLTSCMSNTIEQFRENPKLDILAAGDRKYFNNGVMLARARDRTYDSMIELLRNGSYYGQPGCASSATQMNRKIATDQDIFVEYTSRFPERYQPIKGGDPFNLRPMHAPKDRDTNCSIVHYAGHPKPWSAWFEGQNMSNVASTLPQLVPLNESSILPTKIQIFLNGSKSSHEWSMRLWGNIWNVWNDAVQKWRAVNPNQVVVH
jgi:hypothetical protein